MTSVARASSAVTGSTASVFTVRIGGVNCPDSCCERSRVMGWERGDSTLLRTVTACCGPTGVTGPTARPVAGSSRTTSTRPLSTVTLELFCCASTISTVPRTPAMAFGVRTSTRSPAFIRVLSTATAMRPLARSMVDSPGTSVIVSVERSRAVMTTLPPMRIRVIALSPVVTRSRRKMSSLNFNGALGTAARATVTGPITVVAMPTRSSAHAGAVSATDSASDSEPSVPVVVFMADPLFEIVDIGAAGVQRKCQTGWHTQRASERDLGMRVTRVTRAIDQPLTTG